MEALLRAVDEAYAQADEDRALLERSLELTSVELLDTRRGLMDALRASGSGMWSWSACADECTHEGYPSPLAPDHLGRSTGRADALTAGVIPDDRPLVRRALEEALEACSEVRVRCRTAQGRWVALTGRPHPDATGRLVGLCDDITADVVGERERMDSLRARESTLVQIASELASAGRSPDEGLRRVAERVARLFEARGVSIFARRADPDRLESLAACRGCAEVPPAYRDQLPDYFEALETERLIVFDEPGSFAPMASGGGALDAPIRAGGSTVGVVAIRSNGSRAWTVEERALAAAIGDLIAAAFEAARRGDAERALGEQKRFLREVLDLIPNLVFAKDRDGRFTLVNKATAEVYGTTAAGLVGRTDAEFNPNATEVARFLEDDRQVMDSLAERCVEETITDRDGKIRYLLTVKRPVIGPDGRANLVLGTSTDVTALKHAESARAALEDDLRKAQRMEAIGLLAGGVAHDFNNLLTPILGYTDTLATAPELSEEARGDIEEIRAAGLRAAELTAQLLAFGRRQVLELRTVDLGLVVRDVVRLLARLLPENIRVHVDTPAHSLVRGDAARLHQVLVNLAINARDAMPKGGSLTFRTVRDPERPGCVLLRVTDTGDGIDKAHLPHLFEPFFTTKGLGIGTGLGLSTVYGIVQQHDGEITVSSTVGVGTSFEICLPSAAPTLTSTPSPAMARTHRGGERILVVEDDAAVRRLTHRVLSGHGFRVAVAEDAEQAEIYAKANPERIDLVLSDVMLPGRSGAELANRLQAQGSSVPVLYMSGHPRDLLDQRGGLSTDMHLLQKPFRASELIAAVRDVLDRLRR